MSARKRLESMAGAFLKMATTAPAGVPGAFVGRGEGLGGGSDDHARSGGGAVASGIMDEFGGMRMSLLDRIVIDSEICHGKPSIRGLRYPVETILELLSSEMPTE